ncbi:hypothetical protein GJ744_006781 [Endocarpon pusillum]|uniref:Uncharacterized protein n=1 Tax=Endocarpon pusillum TaxID=364733 RepID=A0A8H7AJK2_9EURO|nr:hypothetical protein GJ744_006781 [Endocarpon pusillum]
MSTQRSESTIPTSRRQACPHCQKSSQVIDDDYIDRPKLEMLLNNLFPEEGSQCGLKWKRNQWIISSAPRCLDSQEIAQLRHY